MDTINSHVKAIKSEIEYVKRMEEMLTKAKQMAKQQDVDKILDRVILEIHYDKRQQVKERLERITEAGRDLHAALSKLQLDAEKAVEIMKIADGVMDKLRCNRHIGDYTQQLDIISSLLGKIYNGLTERRKEVESAVYTYIWERTGQKVIETLKGDDYITYIVTNHRYDDDDNNEDAGIYMHPRDVAPVGNMQHIKAITCGEYYDDEDICENPDEVKFNI
ncbi:MAG: hypothetical protein ACK4SY_10715, partial [Pyrobaculum sp.]